MTHNNGGEAMTAITSICVRYKAQDGWHVFYSEDLPGLYVANPSVEVAYTDVAPAIQALMELDLGVPCRVEPESTLAEFVERTKGVTPRVKHSMAGDRRYMVGAVPAGAAA